MKIYEQKTKMWIQCVRRSMNEYGLIDKNCAVGRT